jgi:5-methylthioadenosine/S-adenosylhomocysteine deaminase
VNTCARLEPDDAALSAPALADAAAASLVAGLRAGITTVADCSPSGASAEALSRLGVRGVAFQEIVGPSPAERADVLAALGQRVDRLRVYESALLRLGVAPRSVAAVHEDLLVDACAYAIGERLPIAIGVAESVDEIAFIREGEGPLADALRARGVEVVRRSHSPVHLLKELGVLDVARPLLLHCVQLDDTDVDFVAASGSAVALTPYADASLGRGIAPLAALRSAGVAVGLGTGRLVAGARPDLVDEARLAALLQSVRAARPHVLSPTAAIELATLGGARALGVADRIGSLEVGKEADLVAFPLSGAAGPAMHDPASAVLHSPVGSAAAFVTIAGVPRIAGGRLIET